MNTRTLAKSSEEPEIPPDANPTLSKGGVMAVPSSVEPGVCLQMFPRLWGLTHFHTGFRRIKVWFWDLVVHASLLCVLFLELRTHSLSKIPKPFSCFPPNADNPRFTLLSHTHLFYPPRVKSSLRIARALPHCVYISMSSDDKTHRRVIIVCMCVCLCASVNAGASMSQCTWEGQRTVSGVNHYLLPHSGQADARLIAPVEIPSHFLVSM